MICNVTGRVYLQDGRLAKNYKLYLVPEGSVAPGLSGTLLPHMITVKTDNNGDVDFNIVDGQYQGFYTIGQDKYSFTFTVPNQAAADFADCLIFDDYNNSWPYWLEQAFEARDEALQAAADAADLVSGALNNYATRDDFVAAYGGGKEWEVGAVVNAGGHSYRYIGGVNPISDLAGWVPQGPATLHHWGVSIDDEAGGEGNGVRINAALAYQSGAGVRLILPEGTIWHDETLVFRAGTDIESEVYGKTRFKKIAGFNDKQAMTEGFDEFTGTDAALECPADISIRGGVIFDGNWMLNDWFAADNEYVNTSGGGVFIYTIRYDLDIDVINQAGVGFWSELNGDTGSLINRKKSRSRIHSGLCLEEAIIFKGPGDMVIDELWAYASGTRIASERAVATTPRVSPTYGAENGGVTDGIVFDGKGAEIKFIHSWNHHSGGPIWTKGNPRIHCELLIGESSAIGPRIADAAYGHIGYARCHNNRGGWSGLNPGQWPDFHITSTGGFLINSIWLYPSTNGGDKGQDRLVVGGVNNQVQGGIIDGVNLPGHGVVLNGDNSLVRARVSRCKGAPANGDAMSYAVKRVAPFANRSFEVDVNAADCDGYFLSSGAPNQESIRIMFKGSAGQTPFSGDVKDVANAQLWSIHGEVDNVRYMSDTTVDAAFDSSLTTEQQISIPHRLIYQPAARNVMLSYFDTSTGSQIGGSDAMQYMYVYSVDANNINIRLKMSTAHATNTSPRVSARVCI